MKDIDNVKERRSEVVVGIEIIVRSEIAKIDAVDPTAKGKRGIQSKMRKLTQKMVE